MLSLSYSLERYFRRLCFATPDSLLLLLMALFPLLIWALYDTSSIPFSFPPEGNFFLFVISFPAGFLTNRFTFQIFLLADGNVAGCGYHFGSADNDNPLAFLSSQKRGGSPRVQDILWMSVMHRPKRSVDLSKRAFVILLTAFVPVALSFLPTEENNLHSVTAYLPE